ncbi:MAG: papain fold toxin domain-containing protein, partial [Bacteroidota bacterium]
MTLFGGGPRSQEHANDISTARKFVPILNERLENVRNGQEAVVLGLSTARKLKEGDVEGALVDGAIDAAGGKILGAIGGIIAKTAKKFKNLECVECADAIMDVLKKEGISGEIVTLEANSNKRGFIWSDFAKKNISENGHHRGVLVDGKVYDNVHPEGINYE